MEQIWEIQIKIKEWLTCKTFFNKYYYITDPQLVFRSLTQDIWNRVPIQEKTRLQSHLCSEAHSVGHFIYCLWQLLKLAWWKSKYSLIKNEREKRLNIRNHTRAHTHTQTHTHTHTHTRTHAHTQTNKQTYRPIGIMVRGFASCSEDRSSLPGRIMQKTKKLVLDASLLNTQHLKVRIKSEWSNPEKKGTAYPTPQCSFYWPFHNVVTYSYLWIS